MNLRSVIILYCSHKTKFVANCYQLYMRCPCTITLMVIHEASSYNATPHLYAVTIGSVCCKRERGSMLRPAVHQSISIANNFLFTCTIFINFHVHSRDMLESKKKYIYTYWNYRHDRIAGRAQAVPRSI